MRVRDHLVFAVTALRSHPVRTGLCVGGVSIGVAAVLTLTALGEGARQYVVREFSAIGSNLILLVPGKTETTGAIPGFGGVPHDLTLHDVQSLKREILDLELTAPISMGTETVRRGERSRQVPVVGTTAEFYEARALRLQAGRFLPSGDLRRGAPVVVLGKRVADELFPHENPVGHFVRVGTWRMRVIGVLAKRGVQLAMDMDDIVLVPVATGMKLFNRHSLYRVLMRVHSTAELSRACQRIVALLTERHGEEDVTCVTQDAVVSTFSSILAALTAGLVAIGAISLSVAGIGVMNVMLMAVTERTEEIGLLKAIGARDGQIRMVFLAEATLLTGTGGFLGLAVGKGVVVAVTNLYPMIPAATPSWATGLGLGVSMVIGLIFGMVPAHRASRLAPIHALEPRVS